MSICSMAELLIFIQVLHSFTLTATLDDTDMSDATTETIDHSLGMKGDGRETH